MYFLMVNSCASYFSSNFMIRWIKKKNSFVCTYTNQKRIEIKLWNILLENENKLEEKWIRRQTIACSHPKKKKKKTIDVWEAINLNVNHWQHFVTVFVYLHLRNVNKMLQKKNKNKSSEEKKILNSKGADIKTTIEKL